MGQYQAAINGHDVATVMSLYTRDAEFELVGTWKKKGEAELRAVAENDAESQTRLQIRSCREQGESLTCQVTESALWLEALGMPEVRHETTFAFSGRQIARIRASLVPEDARRIGSAMQSLMGWATQNQPHALAEIMPGGSFRYGRETARKWLALIRAWRQASTPR